LRRVSVVASAVTTRKGEELVLGNRIPDSLEKLQTVELRHLDVGDDEVAGSSIRPRGGSARSAGAKPDHRR
jgi:hypothetical protein